MYINKERDRQTERDLASDGIKREHLRVLLEFVLLFLHLFVQPHLLSYWSNTAYWSNSAHRSNASQMLP